MTVPCLVTSLLLLSCGMYSAGTWRKNDVVLTSMRRDYVASTSIRRHFGTKSPLGRDESYNAEIPHNYYSKQ